jgi:hypothetical protein
MFKWAITSWKNPPHEVKVQRELLRLLQLTRKHCRGAKQTQFR